jgi:hypothetical protein
MNPTKQYNPVFEKWYNDNYISSFLSLSEISKESIYKIWVSGFDIGLEQGWENGKEVGMEAGYEIGKNAYQESI